MQILGQRDPRWGNINLGNSNTFIKDYGCTITCLAMIIGTTPDVVNDRLKAVGGFAQGNLVIWGKISEAFPGIKINRVWVYNNDDVLNNVPNVLVEVPPNAIGGVSGKHWVVFIGNKECNDPWTGSKRPTNDFLKYGDATGYCVVSGKWAGSTQPTEPMVTLPQKELDLLRNDRDTNYNKFIAEREKKEKLESIIDEKNRELRAKHDEIGELNAQIEDLKEQLAAVKPPVDPVEDSNPTPEVPHTPTTPESPENQPQIDPLQALILWLKGLFKK